MNGYAYDPNTAATVAAPQPYAAALYAQGVSPAAAYDPSPAIQYATAAGANAEVCEAITSLAHVPQQGTAATGTYAGDEIRTVFITGFPDDVKERELNNMLRFLPGYQASQMNWKNGQAQGFALFMHPQAARSAIDCLHSLCFDPVSVLRAELARKNMYLRDDYGTKRQRASGPEGGDQSQYSPGKSSRENPPCNTLFIGNLSEGVSKQELEGLFAHQKGFQQMKIVRAPRGVNCFIEFEDISTAATVRDQLQGAVLASSDKGSLRVEFSKNPLGKKRDRNGNLVDHAKSFPRYQPVDVATLMPEHIPSAGIEGVASAAQGIYHLQGDSTI